MGAGAAGRATSAELAGSSPPALSRSTALGLALAASAAVGEAVRPAASALGDDLPAAGAGTWFDSALVAPSAVPASDSED
ncbi:MAG: hypothetical protein ABI895_29455 [Deltaproteobacteria bacterium]